MSRVCRFAVGGALTAAVAVALAAFADPVLAQQGKGKGGGFEKKGFEKKEFDKKEGERKEFDRKDRERKDVEKKEVEKKGPDRGGSGEALRALEAELARLKEREADLEARLRQLRDAQKGPPAGPRGFGPGGMPGMGGFGRGGPGGFGPGMPGGFGRGGAGGPVEGITRAAGNLSVEQLREVIGALDKLRAEKERAAAPAPRPKERPEGRPGGASQDEILRKLDQLTREIEEIRRAIRR